MILDNSKGKNYSAIVLAAGRSKRMGTPKLLLPFNNSETFVEHIVNAFNGFGCKEVVLVINQEVYQHLLQANARILNIAKCVQNTYPEKGRFYSLQLGANALESNMPVFIQNIDNPFVDKVVLHTLCGELSKSDYILPTFQNKGGHPILISTKVITAIQNSPNSEENMKVFLRLFSQSRVPVNNEKILANINCPKEYEKHFLK